MNELPIFPKGVHQLLGWVYSMEGIDPHEPTAHAKLMEKVADGEIRPFPAVGINLKDLSQIERYGLAAGIRQRVEQSLTEDQRNAIWARYCDSTCRNSMKREGMAGIAERLHCELRRSKELVADCVWHIVCTDRQREDCSMYAIGKRHGVSAGTVHSTVVKIRKYIKEPEAQALRVIRSIFAKDGVL